MPTAEITCQYVNFPKAGKRRGSIKSSEGDYYWGSDTTLRQFAVGEVCTVEYDTQPKDGGGEWRTIKRKVSTTSPGSTPTQVRNRTNPADSKQIFVTALLKEGIASGKIEPSKVGVVSAGNALKAAYEELFGTPAKQTTEAELNDEIPEF